jgi:hypothetical protein
MGPVDGCADAGATRQLYTLGQSFDKIAFTVNTASSVAPSGAVVRGELHRAGDPADVTYCAAIIGSPAVILLTSFNTKCWCDPTTTFLKSSDVPNIDWIGVRIMADNVSSYEVSGFCVSKIEFSN